MPARRRSFPATNSSRLGQTNLGGEFVGGPFPRCHKSHIRTRMSFSRMPAASLIGIIMAGCAASGPHPREERDFLFAGWVCRRCSNCGPLRRGGLAAVRECGASGARFVPGGDGYSCGGGLRRVFGGDRIVLGCSVASRPFPRRKQENDRRDPGGYFLQMP
jgi:hypothetical protein